MHLCTVLEGWSVLQTQICPICISIWACGTNLDLKIRTVRDCWCLCRELRECDCRCVLLSCRIYFMYLAQVFPKANIWSFSDFVSLFVFYDDSAFPSSSPSQMSFTQDQKCEFNNLNSEKKTELGSG